MSNRTRNPTPIRQCRLALLVLTITSMTGCVSFSGYGGANGSFACKAPDGVQCQSMTGIYANAMANNLPSQQVTHKSNKNTRATEAYSSNTLTTALSSGQPLRSSAEVVRLWLAPWQDTEGDLHDQKYVYLVTDYGTWNLAHTRSELRTNYSVVKPPQNSSTPTETAPAATRSVTKPGVEATGVAKEALEQSRAIMNEATGVAGN